MKAEFLNAFNRHIFSVPDNVNPYDSTFGQVRNTIDQQRVIQLTGRFTF